MIGEVTAWVEAVHLCFFIRSQGSKTTLKPEASNIHLLSHPEIFLLDIN